MWTHTNTHEPCALESKWTPLSLCTTVLTLAVGLNQFLLLLSVFFFASSISLDARFIYLTLFSILIVTWQMVFRFSLRWTNRPHQRKMSVFGLLSGVAGFVKVRYLIDKAIIDNMIFRCHYRITSAVLFVCCIVVTANNLIGKFITKIDWRTLVTWPSDLAFLLRRSNFVY